MDKEKYCMDCKKKFIEPSNSRYPRKYCDKCSSERKEAYKKIGEIKFEDCED